MTQTIEKVVNPVFWDYSWKEFKLFNKNSETEISSIADLKIVKEVVIDILKEYEQRSRNGKNKAYLSAIKDKYKQIGYCDRRAEELKNCTDSLSSSNTCYGVAIESRSSTKSREESKKQLELFCTDSLSNYNPYHSVAIESKSSTDNGHIGTYTAGGSCRSQNKYFRYSYRDGNKMKHLHIRGGNTEAIAAETNAFLIQLEIDRNQSVKEIIKFIKTKINV